MGFFAGAFSVHSNAEAFFALYLGAFSVRCFAGVFPVLSFVEAFSARFF